MPGRHTFRRESDGSPTPVEFVFRPKVRTVGCASGPAPRGASPLAGADLRRVARQPGGVIAGTENDMRRTHMLRKHTFEVSLAAVRRLSGSFPDRKSALLGVLVGPRRASPSCRSRPLSSSRAARSAIASTEHDMRRVHMLRKHTFRRASGGSSGACRVRFRPKVGAVGCLIGPCPHHAKSARSSAGLGFAMPLNQRKDREAPLVTAVQIDQTPHHDHGQPWPPMCRTACASTSGPARRRRRAAATARECALPLPGRCRALQELEEAQIALVL
jgi:hypothetical protein